MHPKKAEVLKQLEETSRVHDASLRRSLDIVVHPERFGWRKSILTAAVVVPLTGVSAMLTDLSHVLLTRSDDRAWDKPAPPDTSPTDRDQSF